MNKVGIITAIVILIAIISFGITECVVLNKEYAQMQYSLQEMMAKTKQKTVTTQDCEQLKQQWLKLREHSELVLPHLDIYEMNLRLREAASSIEQEDYKTAYNQYSIALMLAEYIPHLMIPSFVHIF